MRLAVSSLAWDPRQDDIARATLVRRCITGIEVAPMAYWPDAPRVAPADLARFRDTWARAGLAIVALQGVLFGKPALQLFGSRDQRAAFDDHLTGISKMASALGASVVVLGSPKNRMRGAVPEEEAIASAAPLLNRVARVAADNGVVLCIEPNPPRYGADFATTTVDARRLVEAVGHAGFGLHLDAGALEINGDGDAEVIEAAAIARHFHASEIDLAAVGSGTVDHARLGGLLRQAGYGGWVSIEMNRSAPEALVSRLERAIDIASAAYA
ncbi:MAG: xylose isomerase [Gemmatimonadetes bacterium]|nr:xylose isomerase [Gemmatimonadota bacterium]